MGCLDALIARRDRRRAGRAAKLSLTLMDCSVLRVALMGLPRSARELPEVASALSKVVVIQDGEE